MTRMHTAAAALLAMGALAATPALAQQNQQGQGMGQQGQMPGKQQMQQMHEQMQGQGPSQGMGQGPSQGPSQGMGQGMQDHQAMQNRMHQQMHEQMHGTGGSAGSQASTQGAPLYVSPAGVQAVQQTLKDAGYDVGEADGSWGPRTSAALREFQEVHGLAPTGNLNLITITTLGLAIDPTGQQAEGPDMRQNPQDNQAQ